MAALSRRCADRSIRKLFVHGLDNRNHMVYKPGFCSRTAYDLILSVRTSVARNQPASKPGLLQKIHEPSKRYLEEWIGVPAHIHHVAYRMANPPLERPQSRKEFNQLLQCMQFPEENCVVSDKFGYGVRVAPNGDRLLLVWEAHTEYYSYQIWHVPSDNATPLEFGPLTFPEYYFPICPLGIRVNALDLLITAEPELPFAQLRQRIPGPHLYGSRVFGEDISVVTSFTPDADLRERYFISSTSPDTLLQQLTRLIDSIVAIENYYHLVHLPFQAFSRAVDQVHDFEQRHLYQRAVITEQLSTSTQPTLQKWLNALTQDFLQVSRLAESMRFKLSGSVPYDRIVRGNLQTLQERPFPPLRPLSDYVLWRITGVADGYQQLLRRIDALQNDFDGTITVIRTRIELLLQDQNLALQDQNLRMLASVDKTTRSQAILQHTVESLSVIVITYYLAGLGNYVFKALHQLGWIANATYATAIFVPIALGFSFGLLVVGRKLIYKRMSARRDT